MELCLLESPESIYTANFAEPALITQTQISNLHLCKIMIYNKNSMTYTYSFHNNIKYIVLL